MRSTMGTVVIILVSAVLAALPLAAERGDDADRVSKNGRTEGEVGGVDIVVEYGQPKVKGREIFGGLVPLGKVWRTGANEATTVELAADTMIEGKALPAGKYALFTIPSETEWTVIFNKVPNQWGAFRYNADEDALRVTVTPGECEHVEEMEFVLEDSNLVLRWANTSVPISITSGG